MSDWRQELEQCAKDFDQWVTEQGDICDCSPHKYWKSHVWQHPYISPHEDPLGLVHGYDHRDRNYPSYQERLKMPVRQAPYYRCIHCYAVGEDVTINGDTFIKRVR